MENNVEPQPHITIISLFSEEFLNFSGIIRKFKDELGR